MEDLMTKGSSYDNYFPASKSSRFLARLIDNLIGFAVGVIIALLSMSNEALYIPSLCIGILAILIVQIYLLSTKGQSIGKLAMKIKIVKSETGDNGGFVPNFLLREVVNNLLSVIPFYGLIDTLFIFSYDGRCLHDKIAGTKVVEV
jgi:uncharacterized RDD family membrane protein YckC